MTGTVMVTATTTTGKDNDDNRQGRLWQRARTAMTMGENKDDGKGNNSEDDGNDARTTGEDGEDNRVGHIQRQGR